MLLATNTDDWHYESRMDPRDSMSMMEMAIRHNDISLLEDALKKRGDVPSAILSLAIDQRSCEAIATLLLFGGDPYRMELGRRPIDNLRGHFWGVDKPGFYFMASLMNPPPPSLHLDLPFGGDVNAPIELVRKQTPLMYAASHGYSQCFRWLVEHRLADVYVKDARGFTVMGYAMEALENWYHDRSFYESMSSRLSEGFKKRMETIIIDMLMKRYNLDPLPYEKIYPQAVRFIQDKTLCKPKRKSLCCVA